ncbi:MAG: preprotein translocase subunit YajC [Planctomycetaceae bacterium]|nr:preprotein translocase subunit YajC [Planctomycetaceae bacterium]
MRDLVSSFILLAQESDAPAAEPTGSDIFTRMLPPFLMIIVVWFFIILRPELQKRKKAEELSSSVKKNDKVITVGGIIGTVTNFSSDGTEVTLRIDDNTKIKMLRSSIQTVVKDETKENSGS